MDTTPIDIKYTDLLKWLTERFFIPNDWTTRLEAINLKKQECIDLLYSKEAQEFKKIQDTFKTVKNDMYHQDIMRLYTMLQKTEEAKDKSFFGYYNTPLMKNIYILVNLYEKNLMHLCESSKLITQNIGYDIPNLEKTIDANNKQLYEISGKIQERNSAINKNNEKLNGLFRTYNIKKTENTNEIALNLISRLPSLKNQVENLEKKLKRNAIEKIINAYANFYLKINGQEIERTKTSDFLKELKRINKEGDYIIPKDQNNNNNSIKASNKYEIISKKMEELKSKYENLNIKADLNSDVWNLNIVGGNNENDSNNSYITALLNKKTRKFLIDDLNELLIFVNHRLNFLNNKDEVSLSIYQGNIREINNELNQDLLKESKKNLEEILNDLRDKDFELLSGIFEDEKKIKGILNSFDSVKTENNNLNKNVSESNIKSSELEKESTEANKKINALKKEAKMVKKIIEKLLTDKMKRKITVIGDANLF